MNKSEVIFFWNYFCSLCEMLKNTMQYVDHSNKKNSNTNSYEFQKIIMLTSMEFENISKLLCTQISPTYDVDVFNIIDITRIVEKNYSEIHNICIKTDFLELYPLVNWKLELNQKGKEQVIGLDWWKKYNKIKHNAFKNYKDATLENAINALASLMVLEIVLVKKVTGSNSIMNDKPCPYFINPYQSSYLVCE